MAFFTVFRKTSNATPVALTGTVYNTIDEAKAAAELLLERNPTDVFYILKSVKKCAYTGIAWSDE